MEKRKIIRRKPVILDSTVVVRLLSDTTKAIESKARKAKVTKGEWVRRLLDKALKEGIEV